MYWSDVSEWEISAEITGSAEPLAEPIILRRDPASLGAHGWAAGGRIAGFEFATDLRAQIGSMRWFRGVGVFAGLLLAALLLLPGFAPLAAAPSTRLSADSRAEMREIAIAPLALGADTGSRMGPLPTARAIAALMTAGP